MEGVVIRNAISTSDVDVATRLLVTVFPRCYVSVNELDCALTIDLSAFYLGKLDDDFISLVVAVKYPGHSAFISCFAVREEYRSRGYGKRTWLAAWESLEAQCTVGLDAATHMIPKYEAMGFRQVWNTVMVLLDAERMLKKFTNLILPPTIKQIDSISVNKLANYDASVFGTPREKFVEKWTRIPGSSGWIATTSDGDVAGYIVVRQVARGADMKEQSLMIGPLYADDDTIAALLLKAAADAYAEDTLKIEGGVKFVMMCSDGGEYGNHGLQLISGLEVTAPYVIGPRMYTNGTPPGRQTSKIYATTSIIFD